MAVFVLDKRKKPLMPCSEKRARKLLDSGRARIHRVIPFVIRLVDRTVEESELQPVKIKIDPGSKTTGMALVRESETIDPETGEIRTVIHVLNLFELLHRGQQISKSLLARRIMRRHRRGKLRYRAPRFLNRRNKKEGWIAPSLQHRIDSTVNWVKRLTKYTPVSGIVQELVRFDMQKMENPEISGIEYQKGTLSGYELREYLLEKWGRKCAYCDAENVPLNLDHIHPKSKGGSNRVSNLTLACIKCNQKKGSKDIRDFLSKDQTRLKRILSQTKRPLKDAAAVNTTRKALFNSLKETGLPVEIGTGGLTKYNRTRLGIPKTHALDAVCTGVIGSVSDWKKPTLGIKSTGRGRYRRTTLDKYGFPRGYCTRKKRIYGFQTGDMVRAMVPKGKNIGTHIGRVVIRATGGFNIQTKNSIVHWVSYRYCTIIQRGDGYGYSMIAYLKGGM